MDKRPKYKEAPFTSGKVPRIAVLLISSSGQNPSWRIRRLRLQQPWGWHDLSPDEVADIRRKLGDLETRTWNEIFVHSSKQNRRVSVSEICKEAQQLLEDLGYGDLDEIVSLRLSAKERIWGVMNESVLTLLW